MRADGQTTDGRTLEALVLGEGFDDLQLRTDDKRVHLLRATGDASGRSRPSADWPTYNGDPGGNRYTTLTQIDKTNVARLAPRWMFTRARTPAAPGHAGRRGRHHVRDRAQRVPRARRRQRPPDLALQAIAHEGRESGGTPTAASPSPAIACSWSPTTRTSSR